MSDEIRNEDESSEQAEANRLLEEAFEGVDLDADGNPCPQGEECAVHHRNDEEILDEDTEFGRIISYVGDYCVITTDNPELENPITILKLVLGQITPDQLPPIYETAVVFVGEEGVLADVRKLDVEGRRKAIRFVQTHDEWANFRDAHNVVANGVKEGLLDLSKPAFEKE